jgi:hypothetical protein
MMKFSLVALMAVSAATAVSSFVTTAPSCYTTTSSRRKDGGDSSDVVANTALRGGMSGDVGIPCEAECALEKYPNLPESIHPGVLSGQAMMDLLRHAKENGACVAVVVPSLGTRRTRRSEYAALRGWMGKDSRLT